MIKKIRYKNLAFLVVLLCAIMFVTSCSIINDKYNETDFVYSGSKVITDSKRLSDGGSVDFAVAVEKYDNGNGKSYIALKKVSYEILNSSEFIKVELTYSDGIDSYQITSDTRTEEYIIDADKVPVENNTIKASMVIYVENGEQLIMEIP